MNHWLKSETLRRCLFPLAFVCIFIVWRLAEHGVRSVWVYLHITGESQFYSYGFTCF